VKRILVTGMGGELGTRVANLLEADPRVDAVVGVDRDPPRRRLRRAEFHRIEPRDEAKLAALVHDVDPSVVVHLGIYEPNARADPAAAAAYTAAGSAAVLEAAGRCRALEHVVVRSGIEVYGRHRGTPKQPDEAAPLQPTSPFGRSLFEVEKAAGNAGRAAGLPVTVLRCAPIVGSHLASPLGRYLRLPVVPISVLANPPFSLLHLEDAAGAVVRAVERGYDGPVNVVAPGTVTPRQAVRLGGRVPLPVACLGWIAVRPAAELLGAPLPDHVHELLTRGRMADSSRAADVLALMPAFTTVDVVKELYEWAEVTTLGPAGARGLATAPGTFGGGVTGG
jgi:UDP-glucose 4-epimerase